MSHCQSTGELADRLGLGDDVRRPLAQAFERWDGRGRARSRSRAQRSRRGGVASFSSPTASKRSTSPAVRQPASRSPATGAGPSSIPELVDLFCRAPRRGARRHRRDLGVGRGDRPRPAARRASSTTTGSTARSRRSADFADLKSPCRAGHSRGVADTRGWPRPTALGMAGRARCRCCGAPRSSTTSA